MKIISITTVKNEADIIESFIRYHLNIVDEMIILNNGSTDDTNYILNQLVKENLPITVIEDKDKYFKPVQKMNFLMKKAILEHGADIVCPIDVDEFITSDEGNPRSIIENLKPDSYMKLKWRTYVPTENDNPNEKFIPSIMTYIRDEDLEEYKVVVHRNLFDAYDAALTVGSHEISYNKKKTDGKVNCIISDCVEMAHFPLRSKEQTLSKVLVSYPNLLCRIEVNPNLGFHRSHYAPMFFKIKNEVEISDEDVMEFAKRYSTKGNEVDEDEEITLIHKPINLDFCKNLDINYDFTINPFSNLLEHYVYLAREVNKFKKDQINEAKKSEKYVQKIRKLTKQNQEKNRELKKLRRRNEMIKKFIKYGEVCFIILILIIAFYLFQMYF